MKKLVAPKVATPKKKAPKAKGVPNSLLKKALAKNTNKGY
jgi:hypothetical protein